MGESWWARQNPPHPSTPRESRFILFLPGPLWLALLIIPENLAGKVTGSPRARVWTKLVNEKRNTGLWGTALVWFKSGGKKRMWREEAEALMATAVHQSPWSCSRRLLTTRVRQLNCGHLYPRISHSHIQTLQWPFHYPSLPTGKLKPRGVSSRWNFQKARVGSSSAPPARCFLNSTQEVRHQDSSPDPSYSKAPTTFLGTRMHQVFSWKFSIRVS